MENDLAALTEKAVRLGQAGDKGPEALRVNACILELDPDNLAALTRRGLCHLHQDDLPAAKEDLSRALELRPGFALAVDALAEVERGWDGWPERERLRVEAARRKAEEERAKAERIAEDFRRVEATTDFDEAYAIGVAASKGDPPDHDLAIAALRKAYELDPRRKVRPGEKPDPGLFEVPTRLARVYRDTERLQDAEKMYLWVLERQDSRYARTGLAAVYEDGGKHHKALETYGAVLSRSPTDAYALRGIGRTYTSLGRDEEAEQAFFEAAETASDRKERDAALAGLNRLRDNLLRRGKEAEARRVAQALERLEAGRPRPTGRTNGHGRQGESRWAQKGTMGPGNGA